MSNKVVLCSRCGKTTTEDDAFVEAVEITPRQGEESYKKRQWVCKECLIIHEAMAGMSVVSDAKPREFNTGATRDSNKDKLAYDQGLSVQVLQTYMEYLGKHRVMKDGSLRDWCNWKKGITPETYRESLVRHTVDAVRKSHGLPLREESDLRDLLCAIIFNASGWLFELLVAESNNRESV